MTKRLKIVADENIPQAIEYFSQLGDVLTVDGRKLGREQVVDADILLVRSVTNVNQALLENTAVKFVATATIGIDHLDIDYLEQQGIQWSAAPGSNADSVVDYMLSSFAQQDVFERLFTGGNVGIVGMGNVGKRLYQRLSQLGINCCAYDPLIPQSEIDCLSTLEQVLAADVICCHAPLTFDGDFPSHHMINAQRLSELKPNAVLINAGRGGVVSNQALKQFITARPDVKVVLDVWENEPAIDCDLLALVDIATPHIAGYSYDGKLAGTAMIYQACCQFLDIEAIKRDHIGDEGLAIEVKHINSVIDGISEAVLAAYPIQRDNLATRDALADKGLVERSAAFDQLRKQYPIRREFSRYRISNSKELLPELANHLSALGFMV